ncbi:uncharacterized protein LOC131237576 [Magnolia sinica]|uniref:uncharacterized protein LOC131237576 n=1 Tax=Magnolia sinica TaxID=86752 RepID=UPI00265B3F71|nr:uncharacterized protein LOC131237576 [Magnolia sinica]
MASSARWGYIRIITGTILGGVLGFYVMHQLETSYKEKMKERLLEYEMEKRKRELLEDPSSPPPQSLPDS